MKFLRTTLIFLVIVAAFVLFMRWRYPLDRQAAVRQIETGYHAAYLGKAAVAFSHTGIIAGGGNKLNWLTEITFISNRDTELNDPALGKIKLRKNAPATFPATFIFAKAPDGQWQLVETLPGIVRQPPQ